MYTDSHVDTINLYWLTTANTAVQHTLERVDISGKHKRDSHQSTAERAESVAWEQDTSAPRV